MSIKIQIGENTMQKDYMKSNYNLYFLNYFFNQKNSLTVMCFRKYMHSYG